MTSLAKLAYAFGLLTLVFLLSTAVGQRPDAGEEAPTPAEQKIRDALDGNSDRETGDGILDDVIGLIQQQGSILDGSSLDMHLAASDAESGTESERLLGPQENQRAMVAEQLLRTARMLVQTGPIDNRRVKLIVEMRAEAVRLLSPATSK